MYMPVIRHSIRRTNGSLRMTPAPETAYREQPNRMATMTEVRAVGYQCPTAAIRAILSPAPKNRYHEAPKRIQPRCNNAASALSAAPVNRKVFRDLCIVTCAAEREGDARHILPLALSGGKHNFAPLRPVLNPTVHKTGGSKLEPPACCGLSRTGRQGLEPR